MSAVRIVESSGSLGAMQVADGSGGFLSGSLTAGSNVTITDAGSGNFTIAASTAGGSTIGTAGDSDYSDGLFTDFTTNTTIGDAIDRFNEVLKALAPAPAPDLDDINSLNTGLGPLSMSFGSSLAVAHELVLLLMLMVLIQSLLVVTIYDLGFLTAQHM